MYQIEKNIEMPAPRRGNGVSRNPGVKAKYPFRKMKVGDSFVIDKPHPVAIARAKDAELRIGGGVKFACRKLDATSARIWRIS